MSERERKCGCIYGAKGLGERVLSVGVGIENARTEKLRLTHSDDIQKVNVRLKRCVASYSFPFLDLDQHHIYSPIKRRTGGGTSFAEIGYG